MMNWYKISSRNIELDQYLNDLATEIASEMISFYGQSFGIKELGKDNFFNPYTKQNQDIYVVAFDKDSRAIAKYSPESFILNVYPNSIDINIRDKTILKEYFRQSIYHELVHAIDPSMMFSKIEDQNKNECDYYCLPYEFNAYSSQIAQDILFQSNKNKSILDDVKKWLMYSGNYPNVLKPYDKIINCWIKNDKEKDTELLRIFKQKLYYSLFEE